MRFTRAARRLMLGYFILHLLTAGLFILVLSQIVRDQKIDDIEAKMQSVTLMLEGHIEDLENGINDQALVEHLKRLGKLTNMRFTLITNEGNVVADSVKGTEEIGPHGDREEVLLAKQEGWGFAQRYSDTLGVNMMYGAQRFDNSNQDTGCYIRVASESYEINQEILEIQMFVWIFALILSLLTSGLMTIFSMRSMQPLTTFAKAARQVGIGKYDTALTIQSRDDEWGTLSEAFQKMQSELNRREKRLLENSQRLEAVLSSMIEGVLAVKPSGEVMLANGAACRMLKLTHPEIFGKKLLEIVRIPELAQAIEKTQLQRTFSKTEFKTISGKQKTLKARVSMLADEDKPGVAIVLHDVTELRQLETMRQDFVANVSHELKTPLASIKAYAETLRLGALHDENKNMQFVEQIEFQAELLNQQILDLLLLARVESGKDTFTIAEFEINRVCHASYDQFVEIAVERKLDFQLDLTQPSPVIAADFKSIETIVKNLIVNAIHYTPENGSISISSYVKNKSAVIEVKDTGIGIVKDQQKRIFERFYRVDKARSRDMGGTGLGLAIVKHLTQSNGGSVHLESRLGKGSCFEIHLPLKTG
ncbi:ATP-binding protein [Mariniblastus sp.]|nr:ATP-binding protein [Mariniblastus sp.]